MHGALMTALLLTLLRISLPLAMKEKHAEICHGDKQPIICHFH